MSLIAVAAMTPRRVIGNRGELPWPRLRADMQHFARLTTGKTVVMGYNTYLSLGQGLPRRKNLVLCRPGTPELRGAEAISCLEEATFMAGDDDVMLIGGGKVYERYLDRCETLHLTIVHTDVPGDAHFPLLGSEWMLSAVHERAADDDTPLDLSFETWMRLSAPLVPAGLFAPRPSDRLYCCAQPNDDRVIY